METYKINTNAIYKNAIQNLVIKCLLSLSLDWKSYLSYGSLNISFWDKTTCKPTLFRFSSSRTRKYPHALQKKAIERAMSKVMRETTG